MAGTDLPDDSRNSPLERSRRDKQNDPHVGEPAGYAPSHWGDVDRSTETLAGSEPSPNVRTAIMSKHFNGRTHIREISKGENRDNKLQVRIGWWIICVLVGTVLIILGLVGFLAFIWFGSIENGTWHTIMAKDWATRSISISALVLRTAVDIQASIGAAMLASLALETSVVRLSDTALISVMRAGNSNPRDLLLPVFISLGLKPQKEAVVLGVAAILLTMTTGLLQFTSTVLLSDLRLDPLPGLASQSPLAYDFLYDCGEGPTCAYNVQYPVADRRTTWERNPAAYSTFAEYHGQMLPPSENVDDTGTLLRAFLPFADAQSREGIRSYTGKALVLDSRVSCQKPVLSNLTITFQPEGIPLASLNGTVGPSTADIPGLWAPVPSFPFACPMTVSYSSVVICQLGGSAGQAEGGLVSKFSNITDPELMLQMWHNLSNPAPFGISSGPSQIISGFPYLVMNITTPLTSWQTLVNLTADFNPEYQRDGPWANIYFPDHKFNASLSICYTAFDTTRLDVELYSQQTRSEPVLRWNSSQLFFTAPDVHKQMGELDSSSAESRGILNIAPKSSWLPTPEDARVRPPGNFVQLLPR